MLMLEEIFKIKKAENSEAFNLRMMRGLSWLKKAYDLNETPDLQYMSLWIAFNALYAQGTKPNEECLPQFLQMLCQKDAEGKLGQVLWGKFCQPVQMLLQRHALYQGFWDYQNAKISIEQFKAELAQDMELQRLAMQQQDTSAMLILLFKRLNTLHIQLMQGGMSCGSAVNRKYMQDCCRVLDALVPVMILLLLENASTLDLGKPFYPVVQVC
ncbi:hypothetical protein [Acinetobacter tianfuensis]|uniref:Apea-like HEPN domain-containing protein n=1 Tax=Acinetobacter tianfuensis TaxID=2419603 RepID=A0A3A8EKH0_9GAMM|nr:hypothetical protein [Acinetobacter tianfuensis]RKG30454.1 hypothetical protein D7V32_11375 [Acinetobacter tianfuensis]